VGFNAAGVVCLIDMGKHSKKGVKRPRRGEGNPIGKVEDAVSDLQDQGMQAPLTRVREIESEAEKVQIMSLDPVDTKAKPTPPSAAGVVCVLDMGEHTKKRIKRLRRGGGNLMEKVEDAITDLQGQGVLDHQVQTVVVVVREESGVGSLFSS
jgi:hypothetical protein